MQRAVRQLCFHTPAPGLCVCGGGHRTSRYRAKVGSADPGEGPASQPLLPNLRARPECQPPGQHKQDQGSPSLGFKQGSQPDTPRGVIAVG